MTAAPHQPVELAVGRMTVRGRGLSAASGSSLASAAAAALARQMPARAAQIGGMTIRLPAAALDDRGAIDQAALARAIARARRESDA